MKINSIIQVLLNFPDHQHLPSWKSVSAAQKIQAKQTSSHEIFLVGSPDQQVLERIKKYQVNKIHILETGYKELLKNTILSSLISSIKELEPDVILFSDSKLDLELAARCSIELDIPIYTQVNDILNENDVILCSRNVFAGKAKQTFRLTQSPFILSVHAKSFSEPEELVIEKEPLVSQITPSFSPATRQIHFIEKFLDLIPIDQAKIIVAGGHGLLNNPSTPPSGLSQIESDKWKVNQGMQLLRKLADSMGGSVAVSRSLVDSGFAPYDLQVGQTGKVVEPEIYIACGISGAIQHTIGMNKSKTIIAINRDENAPIFKIAHYGIHADLYEIIPEWIKFRNR
jgi:electron transfer flavoprotein alpha subunit